MLRNTPLSQAFVLVICSLGLLFALPSLLPPRLMEQWPGWLPQNRIQLGLDLQGGSHLLLELDMDGVIRETLQDMLNTARGVLRDRDIPTTRMTLTGQSLDITLADPATADAARRALTSGLPYPVTVTTEGTQLTAILTERALQDIRTGILSRTTDIIRLRVDESGTKEPVIQPQGYNRIILQLPGVEDPQRMKELLGRTARMTFHLVNGSVGEGGVVADPAIRTPLSTMLLPYAEQIGGVDSNQKLFLAVQRRPLVTGENLIDSQPSFQDGSPVVNFRFNAVGARKFGRATAENVGTRFAIVLDNEVISAPVIREPIPGGSGVISGSFTVESARDLALLLRSGALPAALTVVEERTIGPGLGADSVAAGERASLAALVLVIVITVVMYGRFGTYAAIALLANMILLIGVMSLLQVTMTLPGIAGVVLTIGMAVDANVLIFERIREEQAGGQAAMAAAAGGFRRAIGTIIDSNITTLFAALFLMSFGAGPVRGFGVTLALGIVTSVFSAILVTRMLVARWLRKTRPQAALMS
jgi:preprotein translocase subunit SecD